MGSSVRFRILVGFVCLTVVFEFVRSIKIENQLNVITNDCYERLAIGHRLGQRDIYKTVKANTVPKCQKECTAEGDVCKAFSFGIGEKGNSTCELGRNFIKETATLQPIGTIENVDFDLYIKKLGCKLVIDPQASKPKPNFDDVVLSQSASTQDQYNTPQNSLKPTYLPDKPSSAITEEKPSQPSIYPNEALNKPSNIPQKPTVGYGISIPNLEMVKPGSYGNQKPTSSYTKPDYNRPNSQSSQLIQGSLVSVSPGLQSYLHPVHDILIGENPYSYGKPERPLGYLPETSNGVHGDYGSNNNYGELSGGYGNQGFMNIYKKPSDYDKYKPHDVGRPWGSEFIDNPKFLSPYDPYYDERPFQKPYDDIRPQRPPSNSYGNERPRPPTSTYPDKPERPSDSYGRPPIKPINSYDDERPSYSYNKPQRPFNPYDQQSTHKPHTEKPYKPVHEKPDDVIPHRPYEDQIPPFRPQNLNSPYDDERPIIPNRPRPGGYDSRPLIIDDRIDGGYHTRPHFEYYDESKPPRLDYEIPRPMGNFYDDFRRPSRPEEDHRRPLRPEDDYRRPLRPEDDHRRPLRPEDDHRRPLRPEEDFRRPENDHRHPLRPENDYKRPLRPEDDYSRPLRPEDDHRRPPRPEDDFRRPENDYRHSLRPENDHKRPLRPDDDYRRPFRPEDDFRRPIDHNRPLRPEDGHWGDKGNSYPRPDFHDRRPYEQRRPLRQPEDPNLGYRNPDYLFSANDRHDVVSNSTKYVNSNTDYLHSSNVTKNGSDTNNTIDKNGVNKGETVKNTTLENSIITESTGVDGEKITSIITPLDIDLNDASSASIKLSVQNSRTIVHQVYTT